MQQPQPEKVEWVASGVRLLWGSKRVGTTNSLRGSVVEVPRDVLWARQCSEYSGGIENDLETRGELSSGCQTQNGNLGWVSCQWDCLICQKSHKDDSWWHWLAVVLNLTFWCVTMQTNLTKRNLVYKTLKWYVGANHKGLKVNIMAGRSSTTEVVLGISQDRKFCFPGPNISVLSVAGLLSLKQGSCPVSNPGLTLITCKNINM